MSGMKRPQPTDRRGTSRDHTSESNGLMERQNDDHIDKLSSQVSLLKQITIQIGEEARDQNRLLGDMNKDFDITGGLLGGSMKRVRGLLESGHGKSMCYIVLFAVLVFFIIYYLARG